MNSIKITPLPWHAKCSLPVAVRASKTRVFKLLLLVLYSASRGFSPVSPVTLVFPSPQKPTVDLLCVDCWFQFAMSPNYCSSATRHLNKAPFFFLLYTWFSINGFDGHVGAQNNSKLWLMFCIIIQSNSQILLSLLFWAPTWLLWRQVKTIY